jgi:rod shape-determining protein MreC
VGPGSGFSSLAQPIKVWGQRFSLLLLSAAAIFLLVVSRADPAATARLRMSVLDVASLPLTLLREPVNLTIAAILAVRELQDLRAENERLRAERDRLLEWQGAALRVERENAALRAQLNIAGDPAVRFLTARVIAGAGGPYVRSLLLGSGRNAGLSPGQPVIGTDGLVGRVVDVGERSALVVLLTDLNSRVPVMIEALGERAILAGDNSAAPKLNFLPPGLSLAEGQRVVTSGHGGVFPPGLLVGALAKIGDKAPRLELAVDFDRLEFVRILDFGPGGYVGPPGAASQRSGP